MVTHKTASPINPFFLVTLIRRNIVRFSIHPLIIRQLEGQLCLPFRRVRLRPGVGEVVLDTRPPALAFGTCRPFVPDNALDRKSTRLNSSHTVISYAVFCLKKTTSTEISVTSF